MPINKDLSNSSAGTEANLGGHRVIGVVVLVLLVLLLLLWLSVREPNSSPDTSNQDQVVPAGSSERISLQEPAGEGADAGESPLESGHRASLVTPAGSPGAVEAGAGQSVSPGQSSSQRSSLIAL